jgi:protocatechuate 3,4-dioxygenase beta subunit
MSEGRMAGKEHLGGDASARPVQANRPRTPHQVLGPYYPVANPPRSTNDLTIVDGATGPAQGEVIEVAGRILNHAGDAIAGARIIVWQANSFGRYAHPNDCSPAPADPNFLGFAEMLSGGDGAYRLKTVKPGPYAAGPDQMRPPHIHFEVHGAFERLITQMYFPGEPQNASDRLLISASRPDLLIATPIGSAHARRQRTFKFDIVLARG